MGQGLEFVLGLKSSDHPHHQCSQKDYQDQVAFVVTFMSEFSSILYDKELYFHCWLKDESLWK